MPRLVRLDASEVLHHVMGRGIEQKKYMDQGRRPELVGGGLIRSMGGWSAVLPHTALQSVVSLSALARRNIGFVNGEEPMFSEESIWPLPSVLQSPKHFQIPIQRSILFSRNFYYIKFYSWQNLS
jgi:hypothetical protein